MNPPLDPAEPPLNRRCTPPAGNSIKTVKQIQTETPSCGRGFSFGGTEKKDSNHVRTCRRHVREPVRTPVNTFIFRTAWFLFQVRRPLRKMQANPFFSATSSQAAYRLRRLFMLRIKSHLALISLLLLSAKSPARLACSLASALTTPPLRYQSLAGTAPAARDGGRRTVRGDAFFVFGISSTKQYVRATKKKPIARLRSERLPRMVSEAAFFVRSHAYHPEE